jgi:hypothetical protein
MPASTGVTQIGDYTTPVGDVNKVNALLNLIPDVDNPGSSGAQSGGGFLDEMSPACAVQLRVEITALKAVVT